MKRNLKSQVFFFDLLFSSLFILVVLGLLYSFRYIDSENENIYSFTNGLIDYFFYTEINSLNEDVVIELFRLGVVRDIHSTLVQQIALFYYDGAINEAINLTKEIASTNLPRNFNINITLNNTVLFSKVNTVTIDKSDVVYIVSRTVFGYYNSTVLYGPYVFKIVVWQ